jgi:tetratricopeptide (TPR) repeat protein
MSLRFPVLLHAAFYAALRRLPAPRRSRFRRLAERLAAGHWGGGTRVKKLRGWAKPVFEARQDDGDRVLFTFARSAVPDGRDELVTYLQVWDLVGHDRVDRAASRINRSPEAEFLEYEAVEAETVTEPPPHPALSFDEVPPSEPGVAAGVVELMLPPDDFRPAAREEITGGIRWYVLPERFLVGDDGWQALADHGSEELELKLTAEQYAVVRAPGPVLLSGSAGSGKTTIAVHRLAAAVSGPLAARALYLTYSPWLRDHARRLFQALLACRGAATVAAPEFLTIEELYRSLLLPGATAGRLVDYPEFRRWYGGAFRRGDAALAWEEIRSIVKGASLDPARPLLPRPEYETLGRKRAPLFVGERPRLHEVALRWQDYLRAGGLVDEIDLCRLALSRVSSRYPYDHLICDEAQDLAEIQVELLLRLHPSPRLEGLFLAGDPQQVINPSGFRWAEVRTAIRGRLGGQGRPTPALTTLGRNFRSVRGLVQLAAEVLAWKRDRTGRTEGDEAEESTVAGATPVRVVAEEPALARVVRGFGPRCAVLVGSDEARDRLQTLLDTSRIFTVPEAKGLEFEVVVLWGFIAAEPEPWKRLLDPALDLREDPACRRALHHLYVAVTRARRNLAVYEPPEAPPVWTGPRFAARLDPEVPAAIERLFARAASPAEWIKEGEYFLERRRHRQAAECFRRAGEEARETECLALHHEAAGDMGQAARLWLDLGETERAARCFEQAGAWMDAARLWTERGDAAAASRCQAEGAERAHDWAAAGAAWEALEAWERAARCWSSAGQRPRQLRCLARAAEAGERWPDAARRWEELESWAAAAAAWQRAGRLPEARTAEARGHEAARRWREAARAWREAGDEPRALRIEVAAAEEERRWVDAARIWERLDQLATAARVWKRAGRPEEAARCEIRLDLAEGRFVRAAEALEQLGNLGGAADAWRQADRAGQQPVRPVPLPLPAAAHRPWRPGGKPARLAAPPRGRHFMKPRAPAVHGSRIRALACAIARAEAEGRFDDAATHWRALGDKEQALRCRVSQLQHKGQLGAAAALLEEQGIFDLAATAWARAGQPAGQARCEALLFEKKQRWQEAEARWITLGETKEAARCRGQLLMNGGNYAGAAEAFTRAGNTLMASTMRRLASQFALEAATGPGPQPRSFQNLVPRPIGVRTRTGRRYAASTAGGSGASAGASWSLLSSEDIDRLVAEVRRVPGVRCRDLVAMTGLPAEMVKGMLREAVITGRLGKSGATSATRYWPVEGARAREVAVEAPSTHP